MSCPRSTTTPLSISRSTRPRSSVPTGYVSPILSQGSSWACFKPSEMRLFSASTFRISTSTSSPFFTTSDGCCTRFVHVEDDRLDRLPDGDDLGRVPDVAGPAHFGDVHQALDPGLELDERAVVGDRDDLALHARADGVFRRHVLPRIGLQLLQAEADALALPVDVEHLDLDLLADVHQLGGMGDAAVAHVGDVEQAVHAAQVDERAEVGDVLHDAFADLTDLQLLHQDVALGLTLRLEQHAARHDDVAATLVELDDLELE